MEIIKLQEDSLSIHFDEIEKEILNDLTQDLLAKLGNEGSPSFDTETISGSNSEST